MRVLQSIEGETIDSTHPDFGREANIGLHDIVSQESLNRKEMNRQVIFNGKVFQGKVDAGYCPLCPYSSWSHRTLNNHVQLHFRMLMVCGMADCWYVSHNAEDMWKHTAGMVWLPPNPLCKLSATRRNNTGQYPY